MKITDIISKESIAPQIQIEGKNEIIEYMINLAAQTGKVLDKNQALADVMEREKVLSTGVGKGIALPHAKTKAVDSFIAAIASMKEPIEFDSLDSEPVNLVILLLGPEDNVGMNLKLLSKISRILNNESYRSQLTSFKTSEDIYNFLDKIDE